MHVALIGLSVLLLSLWGCASLPRTEEGEVMLAVVDGEPVTDAELAYSLEIAHRKKELGQAGKLDINEYVQKLIDDKLIMQEARRIGLENDEKAKRAIDDFALREAVMRLYNDEVIGKVSLTDEDVEKYFDAEYEQFSIYVVETESADTAADVLAKVKAGGDFKEFSEKYPPRFIRKTGDEVVISRSSLARTPAIEAAVVKLKPGEVSDVIESEKRYYIVKLLDRKEPRGEDLSHIRGRIEKVVRRQKEKERGKEYLKQLREQSGVKINEDVLAGIDLRKADLNALARDERPVVELFDWTLTVGELAKKAKTEVAMMKAGEEDEEGAQKADEDEYQKLKKDIVDQWIDFKVVDHEALSRHYEEVPEVRRSIDRYRNHLLKDLFIRRVILPKITVSDDILKKYYDEHSAEYTAPVSYKIQQITVDTEEAAKGILDRLKEGADFSWLARNESVDSAAADGGILGWLKAPELPAEFADMATSLKAGEVSPVLKVGKKFMVIRLLDKRKGEVEKFEKVKDSVFKSYVDDRLESIMKKYVTELRKGVEIKVYEKSIEAFKHRFEG